MHKKRLVIVGAGPKGLAMATKNHVLSRMGFETPEIILIEKSEVAAHWTGKSGYTNGQMALGTGPDKDIGYPYDTNQFSPEINDQINRQMMSFSWNSYLIDVGLYMDFIDRGRPTPNHTEWANYLRWVADRLQVTTQFYFGLVNGLSRVGDDQVKVSFSNEDGDHFIVADGFMITGPGKLNSSFATEKMANVFDIERFWVEYKKRDFQGKRIGIVGAGENSASIALALEGQHEGCRIDVISPTGFIFSRGESYFENRVYSDPDLGNWNELSNEDKLNFIKRTDLGVFGHYAQTQLNQRRDIEIVTGRVTEIKEEGEKLKVEMLYNRAVKKVEYDILILATGLDQTKLLKDISEPGLLRDIKIHLDIDDVNSKNLEPLVGQDMSIEGLPFKIHLPMLSRMRQGPGFANLSCLGRLSDRVLSEYIQITDITLSPESELLEVVC